MSILGMLMYGTFYMGRQNFGVAASSLRDSLHLSAIQIGTISGSMLIAYAMGSFASGYLADRFGVRIIVCAGALLSLSLNWVTSFATNFYLVLIPWVANGLVQALGWTPCSGLVTSWWQSKERGVAFGTLLFAAGLSSLAAYVLSLASMDLGGWRAVFRFPPLLLIPALILFYLFARRNEYPSSSLSNELAETPDFSWKNLRLRYGPLLRNTRFVLFCASIGFESAARYGLLVWVPIYLLGHDWRQSGPGRSLMLLLPLGMAFGAACTGFLSDRIFNRNRVKLIVLQMLLGAVITGTLFVSPKSNLLLSCVLLLFAGFCVYGPQAAYWAVGEEIGTGKYRGVAIGMMDASAYIFAALGEVCIGWAVDRMRTTAAIFPTIAIACLLAAFLAIPLMLRRKVIA